jgi:undecaprenyl-diphosphatase
LSSKSVRYIGWTPVRSLHFFLLISVFVALSLLVSIGATSVLDDLISSVFRVLHGNNTLNLIVINLSLLGDTSTLLLLAIALTIIKRTRKIGIVFLTCILTIIISSVYIKILVGRHTPPIIFSHSLSTSQKQIIEEEVVSPLAKNLSYPASHVAIVTCFAYIVELKIVSKSKLLTILIWSYPFFMAFSRLYLMQYYLADVIGGFLLGLVVGIGMSSIMHLNWYDK